MKLKNLKLPVVNLAVVLLASVALTATADAAKRAIYSEVEVTNGGSVAGKVSFEGALPADAVEKIKITKNNDVCGDGDREVIWVDVKDGALRGAFVFIEKIKEGKSWEKPEMGEYLVNQKLLQRVRF